MMLLEIGIAAWIILSIFSAFVAVVSVFDRGDRRPSPFKGGWFKEEFRGPSYLKPLPKKKWWQP